MAEAVGAKMTLMDAAWWGPSVRLPRDDRSRVLFAERALPGIYIVNEKGERFLNEAAPKQAGWFLIAARAKNMALGRFIQQLCILIASRQIF